MDLFIKKIKQNKGVALTSALIAVAIVFILIIFLLPISLTVKGATDTDGDGCTDVQELGTDPAKGGQRDPNNPWDFYDVPVPAIGVDGRTDGVKNKIIDMSDVLAVLHYAWTETPLSNLQSIDNKYSCIDPANQTCNSNGVCYCDDLNSNGIADGVEYDRTPSLYPDQPWRSGSPNGSIDMGDVIIALAQFGHDCLLPSITITLDSPQQSDKVSKIVDITGSTESLEGEINKVEVYIDGGKVGEADLASGGTIITTVDSGGDVGKYSSIAVGSDGLPAIAYHDQTNEDQKIVKCGDPSCSSGNFITIIGGGSFGGTRIGLQNDIILDSSNNPLVVYYSLDTSKNYLAQCTSSSCSGTVNIQRIEVGGPVYDVSLAMPDDIHPHFTYYDSSISHDLKFVY